MLVLQGTRVSALQNLLCASSLCHDAFCTKAKLVGVYILLLAKQLTSQKLQN